MFASLWRRVISADRQSPHRAQRMPLTLLAAMEMPMPVVQMTMPRSHSPEATASGGRLAVDRGSRTLSVL